MTEEIVVAKLKLNYESDAVEAKKDLNTFMADLKANVSDLGKFKTEVVDFSSAIKLQMEAPQRPMREMFSLLNVGLKNIREGGRGAAAGLGSVGLAMSSIVQTMPGLKALAPAFQTVSNAGNTLFKVVGYVQQRLRGAQGDFERVVRLGSDLGEQMFSQSTALKMMITQEVLAIKERLKSVNAEAQASERMIAAYEKEGEKIRASLPALRERVQTLADSKKPLEQKQAALDKLTAAEDRLAEIQGRMPVIERKLSEERRVAAQVTEELNVKMRAMPKIYQGLRTHITATRTAMRRLMAAFIATGDVSDTRLADVERGTRLIRQEMERLRQAGEPIPKELADSYTKFNNVLQDMHTEAEKQRQELEKTDKTVKKFGDTTKVAGEKVRKTNKAISSTAGVTSILTTSISRVIPGFYSVTRVVNIFSRQYTTIMNGAATVTEKAAARIRAATLIAKGAFVALGIAAIGLMKKTGMIATEVTTLEVTMRQVARNLAVRAGADVEKFTAYIENVRQSIKGITTRELLTAMTGFLRARLPVDKLKELAEAAKNFGVTVADMASSEVFGRFNQFIQSGNTALLKRLNIVTTADQMHKKYADTIGKNAEDLTAYEKIQARINGIMEEVSLTTGVYEKAMMTAGKQLSSMKRLVEEAALALGKRFEPIIAKVIFGINKLLEWFIALPEPMKDFIANIVKLTAVVGGLTVVLSVLGPALKFLPGAIKMIGAAIKTSMPWLLAIGVAIGVIAIAIKALRMAWEKNFGGIQDAIETFVDTFKTELAPIIEDIRFWAHHIRAAAEEIVMILTTMLADPLTNLGWIVMWLKDQMVAAFTLIKDVVNGSMRVVSGILWTVIHLLRGEFPLAAARLEATVVDALTVVALVFKNTIAKAAVWGWNLIVEVANGITKAGSQILANVMKWIGNLIGRFLAPGGSPPEEGPLRLIDRWGQAAMETFLRGFGLADFGMLRDIMAPIGKALQTAVAAGSLEETEMVPTLRNVRRLVAQLLTDFQKTGRVNQEVFSQISSALGEGGRDITEYVRRLLEHQKALRVLAEIQERVTEAETAGFVPENLRAELEAAEKNVAATEEAVNWQKEFISAMQDTVDLQAKQLGLLEKMADAMGRMTAPRARAGEGPAVEAAIPLKFPEIDVESLGEGIAKLGLGEVSKDFEEMRDKIQKIVDAIKRWIALPLDEKLESIGRWLEDVGPKFVTWLEDVTGMDFSQIAEDIGGIPEKIIGWLEDITGWDIGLWIETIKGYFGKGWEWIVEKTQWLYDTLIGESLIPELVDGIIGEFERLKKWFVGEEGLQGVVENITQPFKDAWRWFGDTWKGIVKVVSKPLGIIAALGAPFAGSISAIFETVKTFFTEFLPSLWTDSGPVLESLQGLFSDLGETWQNLTPILEDLWNAIWPVLSVLGTALYTVIMTAAATFQGFLAAVQRVWPRISGIITGALQIVVGILQAVLIPAINLVLGFINLLLGNTEAAGDSFRTAWEGFREGVRSVAEGILKIILNLGAGIVESIGEFLVTFLEKIATWAVDVLVEFGLLSEDTGKILKLGFETIAGKVREWLDNISGKFTEWIDDAVLIWNGLTDLVVLIWEGLFKKDGYIASIWKNAFGPNGTIAASWKKVFGKDGDINKAWTSVFGEDGFINTTWKAIFGENGYIATSWQQAFGPNGSVSAAWDKVFGKEGRIAKGWEETFGPDGVIMTVFNEIFGSDGLIKTKFDEAIVVVTEVVAGFLEVGQSILDNIWQGILDGWETFKSNFRKKIQVLRDMLPLSEPKDASSPLYGLSKTGEAIVRNIAEGMNTAAIGNAFSGQLATAVANLQSGAVNTSNRNYNMQPGSIQANFPNVRTGGDAQDVMTVINDQVERSTAMSRFRS